MPKTSAASAADPVRTPPQTPPAPGVRPRYAGELRDVANALQSGAARTLSDAMYGSWLYRQTLKGAMPDRIAVTPPEYHARSLEDAQLIMRGRFRLPGGDVRCGEGSPFKAQAPSERWAEELHGFGWLRHLSFAGGDAVAQRARALAGEWLESYGAFHPFAWRPHIIGRRLLSWVAHGRVFLSGADMVWRSDVLRSMGVQARHLARTAQSAPEGLPRLTAAAGLAAAHLAFNDAVPPARKGFAMLARELDVQILPDGSHVSRNPEALLDALCDTLGIASALTLAGFDTPAPIRASIDRMMPMLRFFRHGDGQLALFNGATEAADGALSLPLAEDQARGKPVGFAAQSGYHRAKAGKTLVIVDAGPPPAPRWSADAHAAPLAFELSHGQHRVIVNCGSARSLSADWRDAMRATPAHSTVTVGEASCAAFVGRGLPLKLLGPRMAVGPDMVGSRRSEDERGVWIDMSHDGYEGPFGVRHERRLYLTADGGDFRGEDRIAPVEDRTGRKPLPVAARFHVHPDVRVSVSQSGDSVILRLPNGEGFRFRCTGGQMSLAESVYLGSGDQTRRAEQIVVAAELIAEPVVIQWAFRIMSAEAPQG